MRLTCRYMASRWGHSWDDLIENILLCHHGKIRLNNFPVDFKPALCKLYIDDTFLSFKAQSHIDNFLQYLNTKHENIEFTAEVETDNSLSFLDLYIFKHNNNFINLVYRKNTFSGLGIHILSNFFNLFKTNAINTLIHKSYYLSSIYTLLYKEITFLESSFANKISKIEYKISSVPRQKLYFSLPSYGKKRKNVANNFTKKLSTIFPHIQFISV